MDDRPKWARRSRRKIPTVAEYKTKNRDDQIIEIGKLSRMRAELHNPTMGILFTVLGVAVAGIAFAWSAIPVIPSEPPSMEVTHCRQAGGGYDCWQAPDLAHEEAAVDAAYMPVISVAVILFFAGMGIGFYMASFRKVPWIEQRLEEYRLHLKSEETGPWQMELGWMTIPIKPLGKQ